MRAKVALFTFFHALIAAESGAGDRCTGGNVLLTLAIHAETDPATVRGGEIGAVVVIAASAITIQCGIRVE